MSEDIESISSALKESKKHISFEDDGWARRRATETFEFIEGKNLKILNAGCGPGFDSEEFKKAGHYVIGIDFDKRLVDFATKKGFQDEGKVVDLNKKLPFKDNEFDAVFCSEVVEHLPIISVFLQECKRVIKKDGLLLLTTDNPAYIKHRIRLLFGKADFLAHPTHVHLYTPGKMQELFEKNGFSVLKKKNIGNFPRVSWGDVYLIVGKRN